MTEHIKEDGFIADAGAPGFDILVHDDMAAAEPAWRRLEAHPLVSLHQGWGWCKAWVDSHRHPVRIVEIRQSGEPMLILPLELVESRLHVTARLIGAEHSNLNTGLFSEHFVAIADDALMQAILARLAAALPGVDLVHLPCLATTWGGRTMPLALIGGQENHNRTYQLPLLEDFEATLGQLSAKRRKKNFRASMRKLEEMGGADHVVADKAAEGHRLLDDFFRLRSARFAEQGLPDVFADAAVKAHFHGAIDAATGREDAPLTMHALVMRASGEPAAIAGVSRKGGHVICQFTTIGQGPERAAWPGEALFYLMIEHAQATGASLFDFGMGSSQLKENWTSRETVLIDATIPLTLIGRLAALKEEATLRAKGLIKQNPALYGLVQRLRARTGPGASPAAEAGPAD